VIIDPLKVKRNYALFIPKSDSEGENDVKNVQPSVMMTVRYDNDMTVKCPLK
jgi:hypothetical protein